MPRDPQFRCSATVTAREPGGFSTTRRCSFRGTRTFQGRWYCSRHDPWKRLAAAARSRRAAWRPEASR